VVGGAEVTDSTDRSVVSLPSGSVAKLSVGLAVTDALSEIPVETVSFEAIAVGRADDASSVTDAGADTDWTTDSSICDVG